MSLKKLIAVVPSKGRPKRLTKNALPFVQSLGIDFMIVVEPQDLDKYKAAGVENLFVLKENDQGLGYAMKNATERAKTIGYEAIFKIDDDVKAIGEVKEDLPKIAEALLSFEKVAAISFPYAFEWYAITPKNLFTRVNKRIQTCYIIKIEQTYYREDVSTFEDFWQFLNIRNNHKDVLYCSKHGIECAAVGSGEGGLQDFDRSKMAKKEINLFKSIDDSIQVVSKPDKPWKQEPKLVGKKYRSRKI